MYGGRRLPSTESAKIEAPQAPSNERRRREGQGAAGRRGVRCGDEVSPPQPTRGSEGVL